MKMKEITKRVHFSQKTVVTILLVFYCQQIGAWTLPYNDAGTYPQKSNWDTHLADTWAGFKGRYIDAYPAQEGSNINRYGLVFDPSANPVHAVSEGIGYGLLMAVMMNDQTYFDRIFSAAERLMWNGNLYAWKCNLDGSVFDSQSATDADQDICLALIFADTLAQQGIWSNNYRSPATNQTYGEKAQTLIDNIFTLDIDNGRYLKPGDGWSDSSVVNPSYFSPAHYRIFDLYEQTDHDWNTVIHQCYTTLQSVRPGFDRGLSPDWCKPDGTSYTDGTQNTWSYDMEYEAIRVPWHMAIDAIWYGDPRAIDYCNNAVTFFSGNTNYSDNYRMYDMSGNPTQGITEMSVAMWAAGSMGANNSSTTIQRENLNSEMNNFAVDTSQGWWGKTDWDLDVADRYYNQSLAWFGAAILGGTFANIYADLTNISLPVKLSSFSGKATSDGILLEWQTEAELYNIGFNIYRSAERCGDFERIGFVNGHGTTRIAHNYYFVDLIDETAECTHLRYYISDLDFRGNEEKSEIIELQFDPIDPTVEMLPIDLSDKIITSRSRLLQNFPNPFNPETWIPFDLSESLSVTISIFDRSGKIIRQLKLGELTAGSYRSEKRAAHWDGKDSDGVIMPSGIYFYRFENDKFSEFRKMLLLK